MNLTIDDILHALAFGFTIVLILLGIIKGMSNVEMIINILYFTTLNITFIRYFFRDKEGQL